MQELWMDKRPTVILVTHDLREACYLGTRIVMMSARPGRILENSAVEFARPRTLVMTYTPEFTAIVKHLRMQIADSRGVALEAA